MKPLRMAVEGRKFQIEPHESRWNRDTNLTEVRITLAVDFDGNGQLVAVYDGHAVPKGQTVTIDGKPVNRPERRNLLEPVHDVSEAVPTAGILGRIKPW